MMFGKETNGSKIKTMAEVTTRVIENEMAKLKDFEQTYLGSQPNREQFIQQLQQSGRVQGNVFGGTRTLDEARQILKTKIERGQIEGQFPLTAQLLGLPELGNVQRPSGVNVVQTQEPTTPPQEATQPVPQGQPAQPTTQQLIEQGNAMGQALSQQTGVPFAPVLHHGSYLLNSILAFLIFVGVIYFA